MKISDWKQYTAELTSFNEAKAKHEAAIQAWKWQLASFDLFHDEADKVAGFGCMVFIISGVIALSNDLGDQLFVWSILYFVVLILYYGIDKICRSYEKNRFLATVPIPCFDLQEPIYEPPQESSTESSSQAKNEAILTLEVALHTLHLSKLPTPEELKRAYYSQIRDYHPDKVDHLGSEIKHFAECKTKIINDAYEFVSKLIQPNFKK
jgi:hypothetical protein